MFSLQAPFLPSGDQPQAIAALIQSIETGQKMYSEFRICFLMVDFFLKYPTISEVLSVIEDFITEHYEEFIDAWTKHFGS